MAPFKRKPSDRDDDVIYVASQNRNKVPRPASRQTQPQPQTQTQSQQPSGHVYMPCPGDVWSSSGYEEALNHEIADFTGDVLDDESLYAGFQLYGTLPTKIVGVRYYGGYASAGEYVSVRREPNNVYDSNAIRINNVMGIQIGHLPRDVAAKLAKYIDNKSLLVEGSLAGTIGEFSCPISLRLLGPTDPGRMAELIAKMKADRLPTDEVTRKPQGDKRRKAEELARIKHPQAEYVDLTLQSSQLEPPSMEQLMADSERINPRQLEEIVENDKAHEKALARLPRAEQPDTISTQLLPYQLQAVAWMLDRENPKMPGVKSKDCVQLWQRSGHRFRNIATNYETDTEPHLASGGILADDMGLGKTLEMIAVMMSDRTGGRRNEKTLIVAPLSVMSNWTSQIERHVKKEHAPRILVYHGSNKKQIKARGWDNYDVIITTYGALSTEYSPKNKEDPSPIRRKDSIFSVQWRRIILDEGHVIRNPLTRTALAAYGLQARSRWVLTGTPIVNTLKDLQSYIRFINLSGGLEQWPVFRTQVVRPFLQGYQNGIKLLEAIMSALCLRRKKEMSFVNLKLPELTEYVHRVKFAEHEQIKYDAFAREARGLLAAYINSSELGPGNDAAEIFCHLLEVLLRLRQICNHWKLCGDRVSKLMDTLKDQKAVELTLDNVSALQDMLQLSIDSQEECVICFESLREPVITACGHVFDFSCIQRTIELQQKCPMCRADLKHVSELVRPAEDNKATEYIDVDEETSSSKIEALMTILKTSHRKADNKVVIFSQWTAFLDIVQVHLQNNGFKYTRLDGTMTGPARDNALNDFEKKDDCTIMLASLAVTSVGLNLVAANQVILCDSWWAPAIEDQAVDRIHRLGQTRPTTVWRLVVDKTVEDRVLSVQAEKRKLMMSAFREKSNKRGQARSARRRDIERLLA